MHQIVDDLGEGFGRPDRLEQVPDSVRHLFGEDRLDGLRASAECLIEATKKLPAEALAKRCARSRHELLDACEPHPRQISCDTGFDAERRDWKKTEGLGSAAWRDVYRPAAPNLTCNRMGASCRVGDTDVR